MNFQRFGTESSYRDRWPEKLPTEFIDYVNTKYNLDISDKNKSEYSALAGGMGHNMKRVDEWYDKLKDEISPSIQARTYEKPEFKSKENKFGQWACTTRIEPTNPNGPLKSYIHSIYLFIFIFL